jgi:UDP-GlcNAc3NAcA epimerase
VNQIFFQKRSINQLKIITIVGARPQFIKASMLSRQFKISGKIEEVILHTGQHFDKLMSDVFFSEMNLPSPKYNLKIHSLNHGAMTGRQMEAIEIILIKEKPDYLLVYGDTNSTLAGALAAVKLNIPVIHIEAGMRSFNKNSPEEINRILTDHVSSIYFCTSDVAVKNLYNEGIKHNVFNVGDIMYDAILFFSKKTKDSKIMTKYGLDSKNYILATIHRQENTDDSSKLKSIFSALSKSHLPVIIPLHPRTKSMLDKYKIVITKNIKIVDPASYLEIISLEKNAHKIITDSGGIQKEAFYSNVPCITLREETEWVELVNLGFNTLVGTEKQKIIKAINADVQIIQSKIYGDGSTSSKIVKHILEFSS